MCPSLWQSGVSRKTNLEAHVKIKCIGKIFLPKYAWICRLSSPMGTNPILDTCMFILEDTELHLTARMHVLAYGN